MDADGRPSVGDEITYSFAVHNIGATTLSAMTLDDTRLGLTGLACSAGPLAPGATRSCDTTAVYAVTQAELDAGAVPNTAIVTARPGVGAPVTDDSAVVTPLDVVSGISLTKTAGPVVDANGTGRQDAGDTITYAFTVTNASTVTLTDVVVDDAKAGAVTCDATSLAPRASTPCHSEPYALTQADLDAGQVVNTATTTGTLPDRSTTTSGPVVATVRLAPGAGLTLDKAAGAVVDANHSARQDSGDTVTYTFTVTNAGDQILTGVLVTDPRLGLRGMPCVPVALAPGASANCTAAYTVTQADIDAGGLDNTATASGQTPQQVPVGATDTATVAVTRAPGLALVKRATLSAVTATGRLTSARR